MDREKPVPLWIDNNPIESDIIFQVTNADTDASISAFGASQDIVRKTIDSSYHAFQTWKKTSPWTRRDLFEKAAQLLEERRREIEEILHVETPIGDFMAQEINIQGTLDLLRELAGQLTQSNDGVVKQSKQSPNTIALVMREPIGVQLGIAPWNASLLLGMRAVATPIACGNAAILKASELSPLVHHFIGVLFRDAGFPPGVLNVIQHRREDAAAVLDALIADERVRKVNFTGSTAVGKIIAAKSAEHCKPVLLELGGKSVQVVLDDADLDKAAEAAATAAFAHHGQICMSAERIIVSESVMGPFSEKLSQFASKFQIHGGASTDNATRVKALVEDSISKGGSFLFDEKMDRDGSRLSPRIVTNVNRDMDIWHTETFGPVAVLASFNTVDEAVDLANDSAYGLSASIFSANIPLAMSIAKRLDSGAVHINSMTVHDEAHLPHGGVKGSGWGRFGVPWGFSEFTQLKTITVTDEHLGS